MFTIYGGKTEFQQWELGQLVTNECMKAGDEVVFRNAHGEAYVVKAFEQDGEILADVPNYLLMKDGNILVDLEQGLEHHTDCRTTFNVIAREKPEGYECKHNVQSRHAKLSWNDLSDKPFGEEIATVNEPLNITWDGNTDGLPFTYNFYKVSDLVLTLDQLRLCTITLPFGEQGDLGTLPDSAVFDTEDLTYVMDMVVSVKVDGAVYKDKYVFPEKGLYLHSSPGGLYVASLTSSEPIEHTKTVLTSIDKKYVPFKALLVNFRITGGASATGTANMTYREACEMFDNNECFMAFSLDNHSCIRPIGVGGESRDTYIALICMAENNNGDLTLYWYPDETISMEEPAN